MSPISRQTPISMVLLSIVDDRTQSLNRTPWNEGGSLVNDLRTCDSFFRARIGPPGKINTLVATVNSAVFEFPWRDTIHGIPWNDARVRTAFTCIHNMCICSFRHAKDLNILLLASNVCGTVKEESQLCRSVVANLVSKDGYGASFLQNGQRFECSY